MPPPKTCGAFPRFLRRSIRLHDSKVLAVAAEGESVRVRLDAYLVVSTGQAGTAWSQEVDLIIAGGAVQEKPSDPLWISAGEITVDDDSTALLPIPFEVAGDVVVELRGEEGRLSIRGRGLAVVEHGEKVFVEKVPAASLRD